LTQDVGEDKDKDKDEDKDKDKDKVVLIRHSLGPLQRLLDLTSCHKLTGKGLASILDHCPNLLTLTLKDIRLKDASALGHPANRLAALRQLDLSNSNDLSDAVIAALCGCSPLDGSVKL
jgi:hypothetical protein